MRMTFLFGNGKNRFILSKDYENSRGMFYKYGVQGVKDPRRRKKAGLFSIVFVSLKYTKSKGMGG